MDIEEIRDRTRPGACAGWSGALRRLPDDRLEFGMDARGPGLRHLEWPGFQALVLGQPRPEQAPSPREADSDPVHALLEAFMYGGVSALRRVEGAWALVHWDQASGELHLAVDRLARHPVFIAETAEAWHFGGDPDQLAVLAGLEPDAQRLAAFAAAGRLPAGGTVYAGIRELPPGQHLRIRAEGRSAPSLHAGIHGGWRQEKRERRPAVLVVGEFVERLKSALRVLAEQGALCLLAEDPTETALAAAALAQLPGSRSRLLVVPGWSAGPPDAWARLAGHFGLELLQAGASQVAPGDLPTRRAWLRADPGLRHLAAALQGLQGEPGRTLLVVSARGFNLALPPLALPLLAPPAWSALREPAAPPVAAIGSALAAEFTLCWRPRLAAALHDLPWQPAWPMLDETVAHFLANLPLRMRHGYPWWLDFRRRILRDLLPADLRQPPADATGAAAAQATVTS